ncbi:MAG: cytochrome c biogenesis heme-transporting ATPase CcmA [Halofilum sp. (in: g-proteobacteria)]
MSAANTAEAPAPDATTLALEGLSCVRDDRALFADLSVELAAGEVLQVEGANGSGKTTLLRALCGLVPLETGCIRWQGREIDEAGSDYFAALTYVGHAAGVKRELTPKENLAVMGALSASEQGADVGAALARLGLARLADTPLRRLSAGQCRRVALAGLLTAPTALWILDEPFTALDAEGRELVEQLVGEHCASGGMAVLSTHHRIELAAPVRHLRLGA